MRVFGTADPVRFQAPCFGSPLDMSKIDLNERKQDEIKKMLCIIGYTHPQLEHTPIIPAIVAILTKYLDPNNVLACMTAIVDGHAISAYKRADWAYFPLHRRDYLVFERVFEDLMSKFVPKVARHINKIQIIFSDYAPCWDLILSSLFIGILPRELVVRIFDCYLVEGYKIILRFAIAHLIIRQTLVLLAKTAIQMDEALTRSVEYTPELGEKYFETAMGVKFDRSMIQRYRNRRRKHSIGDYDPEDKLLIFQRPLPILKKPSSFMKDEDWASLWSWIPARYRLLDLELVFTTTEHGHHLSTLLYQVQELEPIILLIETISGKILGAYVSKALTTRYGPTFYGSGETFLFTTKPMAQQYSWDMRSNSNAFICVTDTFVAFGGGADFGLWLDKGLEQVISGSSHTFGIKNPFLDKNCRDDQQIYCLEVFRFL